MAQQATPPDTIKVIRKLKVHECTINGLFSLSCLPAAIIKEKLTELNDLVADIPVGLGGDVFDQWNLKLARWWAQYAEWMDKCQQNGPIQVYASNHSNSGSFVCDFVEQQKKIAICSENKLAKPSTDDIKYRIEQEFAVLPAVTSPTDIDEMKCLLLQISQSLKLFPTFDGNVNKPAFYSDLFNMAIAKLSIELSEQYRQVTQSASHSFSRLFGLRKFIANQIVKFYNQKSGLFGHNSIDTIREQMNHEFGELLKMNNQDCIDQVKGILACVSKTRVHLRPFRNNVSYNQLQSNLFDLAFSKLSLELQAKCAQTDTTNQESKLVTLTKALSKHIVDYYAKKRTTQAQQMPSMVSASNGGDAKFCFYCNSVGHFSGQCDELVSMTCYNCLQTGHKATNCTATDRAFSAFCFECVQFGHFSGYCPTVACYRCKQSGHVVRQCPN